MPAALSLGLLTWASRVGRRTDPRARLLQAGIEIDPLEEEKPESAAGGSDGDDDH